MEIAIGKQVEVIRAAGGLIWADFPGERRLAIVHRTRRYGDEWVLPKGKLEKDDAGWQAAAIREVVEETQLSADNITIDNFADSISYITKNGPKMVLFWNMKYTGNILPVSRKIHDETGEVDEIKWVSAGEARALLRYSGERDLLEDSTVLSYRKPGITFAGKILAVIKRTYNFNSCKRLGAELGPFEVELQRSIAGLPKTSDPEKTGNLNQKLNSARYALMHVRKAKDAVDSGEIECGWRHFHDAQALSLCLDEGAESGKIHATAILKEGSQKLSLWRKDTVLSLLEDANHTVKDNPTWSEIFLAQKILHEEFDNTYEKVKRIQYQFFILALAGLFSIIVLGFSLSRFGSQIQLDNAPLVISIIFFGALGGIISSIFTLSKSSVQSKIPEQILNSWITLMKPLVGAMSALVASVFLLSGILNISTGTVSIYLVLAIAFVAGFTERLIITSVGMIAK